MDAISLANNYSHQAQEIQGQITNHNNDIMTAYHNQSIALRGVASQKIASDLTTIGERGAQLGKRALDYSKTPPIKARWSGRASKPKPPPSEGAELEGEARGGIDSVGEDAKLGEDLLKGGESMAGKVAGYGIKAGVIGMAGVDLASDFAGGHFSVQGANWEEQAENLGNIAGGVLETAGMIVPIFAPELELAGAVISGVSDIIGDIGDVIEHHKEKSHIDDEPGTQTEQIVAPAGLIQEGLVAQVKTS